MSKVGIIANPASGKDIRRLVAYASLVDNRERTNLVRRIILGIDINKAIKKAATQGFFSSRN